MEATTRIVLSIAVPSLALIANIFQSCCACHRRKQNSTFEATLISLNIADIFSSLGFLVSGVYDLVAEEGPDESQVLKFVFLGAGMSILSVISSFGHIVFIAVQRFVAVLYPLQITRIFTKRSCRVCLFCLWLLSALVTIGFYFKAEIVVLGYVMLTCGSLVVILYTPICYTMIKRRNFLMRNSASNSAILKSNQSVMGHSITVVLAYIICNFPYGIQIILAKHEFLETVFFDISWFLFVLNPLLDSLLYFTIGFCKKRNKPTTPTSLNESRDAVLRKTVTSPRCIQINGINNNFHRTDLSAEMIVITTV